MCNMQNINAVHIHKTTSLLALLGSSHCGMQSFWGLFALCYLDASSGSGSPLAIKLVTPFTQPGGIQLAATEWC